MINHQLTCRYCAQEILAREPRWAGREPEEFWHFQCAVDAGLVNTRFRGNARTHAG